MLRRKSIQRARDFTSLIDALKLRDVAGAAALALRNPAAATLLALPVKSAIARLLASPAAPGTRGRDICLISRQRVVGNTNGSSAYLIDLCKTMVAHGWRVHYVCPSPVMFGRWPVLRLQPEMDVFTSLRIRGGMRIGRVVLATDPRIAIKAGFTLAKRVARRLGIATLAQETPAPYAVASPLLRKDQLFVARHARGLGDIVIGDYAFLTEAFAYTLRPDAPTAVIMHDLFSSRSGQFTRAGAVDSVATLSADAEYAMLGQAGTIIAIQADEASSARRHLPQKKTLTAAMSMVIAPSAQPGTGRGLLFIGGKTAPNSLGLTWFLAEIWPLVLAQQPSATLSVIGDVGASMPQSPRAQSLGRVADIAPFYRDAAVVISPLQMGSGLKIKLVEAMAHGKAIVATPVSLQGLPGTIHDAVIEAGTADAFACAVLRLLDDEAERRRRGERARVLAQALFSREVAHAELIGWLAEKLGEMSHPPQTPRLY